MRNKRQLPFQGGAKIAAVVDGETEFWYLQMIKRNEKDLKVHIKPEIPQKKKLSDQYSKVIELSKIYDKVLWIVDLDVILSESATAKRNQHKSIHKFMEYKSIITKKHNNVTIIINQPCLEFWLLIHFEYTSPQFANCGEAEKLLKKYLIDYTKSEKYFTKQDNDIYLKVREKLLDARKNSKKLNAFDIDNPYRGLSEMYKLFEIIENS